MKENANTLWILSVQVTVTCHKSEVVKCNHTHGVTALYRKTTEKASQAVRV